MRINSVSNNNLSFKALMLEKKKATPEQKRIIKSVVNAVLEDSYYVTLIESRYSDVYISPNKDKKSVDLKLLTAAGLNYNFTPKDENGEVKVNLHVPESSFKKGNEVRFDRNIQERTRRFLKRSVDCILDTINSKENDDMRYDLEAISSSDLVNSKISHPEIIPRAVCLTGEPKVSTK